MAGARATEEPFQACALTFAELLDALPSSLRARDPQLALASAVSTLERLGSEMDEPHDARTLLRTLAQHATPSLELTQQFSEPVINPRPALCDAHSLTCHRSIPGHSIAAVRELKSGPWATAGGRGA